MTSSGIPLVEQYRPKRMDDIVLDPFNRQILQNIINTAYFPNLLLYGPPGTGKTTTIINLINAYQASVGVKNKDLVIHLNASDERGIDIIRNQINCFVHAKPLFNNGTKFVILDEVDYMTKNAQQALRYLLQNYDSQVRFCLICNYISKIDEGLQHEFIRLRFNQLPKEDIVKFLQHITSAEGIPMEETTLMCVQSLYKSDIRSMINFIQSAQNMTQQTLRIIDRNVWKSLYAQIVDKCPPEMISQTIQDISNDYNIDKKNIVKDFLNYLIQQHGEKVTSSMLDFIENLVHVQTSYTNTHILYLATKLCSTLSS